MQLNSSQQFVFDELQKFKSNSSKGIIVDGKAGTGKTTLIAEFIKTIPLYANVGVFTLSHKAKNVIKSKLPNKSNLECHTTASLLNMRLDLETGEFSEITGHKPISEYSFLIGDEASMLDEQALKKINKYKASHAKLIFCLDFRQLPPIGEKDSALLNSKFKRLELTERVRQTQGNTILEYSDLYGDAVINNTGVPYIDRIDDSNIKHYTSIQKCLDLNKDLFIESIRTGNSNLLKVITYTNAQKDIINNYVRENFLEKSALIQYQKGDVVILNNNYKDLHNSDELIVLEATNSIEDGYIIYNCHVKNTLTNKESLIKILDTTSVNVWKSTLQSLWNTYQKNKKNRNVLEKYWELRQRYAEVSYNFALSSHKSQGSTYTNCILIEKDIMRLNIPVKEKLQSMYVGITRPTDTLQICY